MADSIPVGQSLYARTGERASATVESIPWTIWCVIAGVTSSLIGGHWDISWHMSIGRDSFWTPAHILIQLNGVLVGIACGYMILSTTFGGDSAAQNASVKIWGFRGPLGAFIAVWGCVAMLTSAPFDNWWHNAYGLDVKIVSPPHVLLSMGSFAIKLGALALMAGLMSRATENVRRTLGWLFVFVGADCVVQMGTMLTDATWPVNLHNAGCYLAVAIGMPPMLIGAAWGLGRRWAATMVAATYTAIQLASEWILPLFPAQPKLGPVYQNITHLVPLHFPLLLIAPATANVLAKLAHGLADDALTCIALALNPKAKVLIAPAMNGKMWLHPATQQNVKTLKARGAEFIGPDEGMLSCGYEGIGRMWPVEPVAARALKLLA